MKGVKMPTRRYPIHISKEDAAILHQGLHYRLVHEESSDLVWNQGNDLLHSLDVFIAERRQEEKNEKEEAAKE